VQTNNPAPNAAISHAGQVSGIDPQTGAFTIAGTTYTPIPGLADMATVQRYHSILARMSVRGSQPVETSVLSELNDLSSRFTTSAGQP
jgi:hypothetical protein